MEFSHSETTVTKIAQSSDDEVAKVSATSPPRRWRVAVGGVSVLAGLLSLPWLRSGPLRSSDEVIDLYRQHSTKFGLVRNSLYLSGLDCPGGFQNKKEGWYKWAGTLNDGRSYWVNELYENTHIFYDRECNGKTGGANSMWGRWTLSSTKLDTEADEDIDNDGKCRSSAYVQEPSESLRGKHGFAKEQMPFSIPDAAGGVPPAQHKWKVYCGKAHGWFVMPVTIKGGWRRIQIKGYWKFLHTAMPGEHIKMETGTKTSSENGGKESLAAEIGMTVTGQIGLSMVGPTANTEISGKMSSAYEKTWKQSAEKTTNTVREFDLPTKGDYNALFQWQFEIKSDSGQQGTSMTNEFAFTPTGAMPPKCAPGGCAPEDCPHYQKCVHGYYL